MAKQEVEVTVVEIKGECAQYRVGDRIVFRNQAFDPKWSTAKVFCVHSINDVYDEMMRLRKEGKVGASARVPCMDKGIVTFEVKLTASE